jgi:hypothetical protein
MKRFIVIACCFVMGCHFMTEKEQEELYKLMTDQKRLQKEFVTFDRPLYKEYDSIVKARFGGDRNPNATPDTLSKIMNKIFSVDSRMPSIRESIVRDSLKKINARLFELTYGQKPPHV